MKYVRVVLGEPNFIVVFGLAAVRVLLEEGRGSWSGPPGEPVCSSSSCNCAWVSAARDRIAAADEHVIAWFAVRPVSSGARDCRI